MVDFVRSASAERGVVTRLEYDPNRSARIALVDYAPRTPDGDGTAVKPQYAYILAPEGLKAGDSVANGPGAGIFPGCALALRDMPAGTVVHNVEMRPGGGGQLCRAAGTSATLIKKGDDGYALLRLASGETRRLLAACVATVGVVGNKEHHNRKLGASPFPPSDRAVRARRRALTRAPFPLPRRQGWYQPPPGPAAARARRGHESSGPPARRRRGQDERRAAERNSLGAAHERVPHA
jgi:large subunit ribosomal protein L2